MVIPRIGLSGLRAEGRIRLGQVIRPIRNRSMEGAVRSGLDRNILIKPPGNMPDDSQSR